jgi:hypothetical protein
MAGPRIPEAPKIKTVSFRPTGYHFQMRFFSRSRGTEQIAVGGSSVDVPISWMLCHLDAGVRPPLVPEGLETAEGVPVWPKHNRHVRAVSSLLRDLCAETRSRQERQRALNDQIEPLVRYASEGLLIVPGIEIGPRVADVTTVWHASTATAVAYGELLFALMTWRREATSRDCTICGRAFLRPRAYTGLLCPLCRTLNAHQKERLLDLPKDQRERTAVAAYRAQLEDQPFTDWPRSRKGGNA